MRTFSTNNATETALDVTRPLWLLKIDFSTEMRLASRAETITFDGDAYTGANFKVDLNRPLPTVQLFNDQFAYGDDFIAAPPGTPVTLFKVYGDGPTFALADADNWWQGFMGEGSVDKVIQFSIRANRPVTVPKYRATWDLGFNYVPPSGSEIVTNAGTFLIERNE